MAIPTIGSNRTWQRVIAFLLWRTPILSFGELVLRAADPVSRQSLAQSAAKTTSN